MTATLDPTVELARIERAAHEYERKRAALSDERGPIYTDHEAREAALLAELDAVIGAATERADAIIREAEAAIDREAHDDPTGRLTADELERANARAPFVKEDADLLPLAALLGRLRAALDGPDRAVLYVHARYITLTSALREAWGRFRDPKGKAAAEARIAEARQFRKDVGEKSGARERAIAKERAALIATGRYGPL